MSWRNRLASALLPLSVSLCLSLSLAACGFHPLYGAAATAAPESELLAGVSIDTIPGRLGQLFKSTLEDRLHPSGAIPPSPDYRLSVKLDHVNIPISVARDGTVSRYNIHFNSEYVLYRTRDQQPVTSGRLSYITSYNNLTNVYFSTYVSEQDAQKRGVVALAELYRQRLATYLDKGAPQEPVRPLSPDSPLAPDSLLRQKQGTTINLK
jgi:LPS-assembly lipoprotein